MGDSPLVSVSWLSMFATVRIISKQPSLSFLCTSKATGICLSARWLAVCNSRKSRSWGTKPLRPLLSWRVIALHDSPGSWEVWEENVSLYMCMKVQLLMKKYKPGLIVGCLMFSCALLTLAEHHRNNGHRKEDSRSFGTFQTFQELPCSDLSLLVNWFYPVNFIITAFKVQNDDVNSSNNQLWWLCKCCPASVLSGGLFSGYSWLMPVVWGQHVV